MATTSNFYAQHAPSTGMPIIPFAQICAKGTVRIAGAFTTRGIHMSRTVDKIWLEPELARVRGAKVTKQEHRVLKRRYEREAATERSREGKEKAGKMLLEKEERERKMAEARERVVLGEMSGNEGMRRMRDGDREETEMQEEDDAYWDYEVKKGAMEELRKEAVAAKAAELSRVRAVKKELVPGAWELARMERNRVGGMARKGVKGGPLGFLRK